MHDYSTTASSLYAEFAQNSLNEFDAPRPGTGARNASLLVDENVRRNALDTVGCCHGAVGVVKVGKSKLVAIDEFPGGHFGGVELGYADDVNAGVKEIIPVEGGDRGQLPRTVWSPGGPKCQQGGGAVAIGEVYDRAVERFGLEQYGLIALAFPGLRRDRSRSVGRGRPWGIGWRLR